MKELSLNNLGVQELDAREMVEVDGGFAWIAVVGAIIYVYNNWDDFAEGFKEGVAEHYQD
ncbi:MAG: class IIb bacteriocin, lactobin A/cerein 7B family [Bacteroidales bacterium]|nr:class IIb bacteriocin, lactobin A/cerein 7B family [Bacteroidales bacterium]